MTNREWLNMLAHEAPDQLTEFFDAEHVDPYECSRERVEAMERALEILTMDKATLATENRKLRALLEDDGK